VTGCLLNERADECAAARGYSVEAPEVCPGPRKYGFVWLGVRLHVNNNTMYETLDVSGNSDFNNNVTY
jgi:hypothetical protein